MIITNLKDINDAIIVRSRDFCKICLRLDTKIGKNIKQNQGNLKVSDYVIILRWSGFRKMLF